MPDSRRGIQVGSRNWSNIEQKKRRRDGKASWNRFGIYLGASWTPSWDWKSDKIRSDLGQIRSDLVRSGQIWSDQIRSGQIKSDLVRYSWCWTGLEVGEGLKRHEGMGPASKLTPLCKSLCLWCNWRHMSNLYCQHEAKLVFSRFKGPSWKGKWS